MNSDCFGFVFASHQWRSLKAAINYGICRMLIIHLMWLKINTLAQHIVCIIARVIK